MFYCWLTIKYLVENMKRNPNSSLIKLTQKLCYPNFYYSPGSPFYGNIALLSKKIVEEVCSDFIKW